MDRHPLKAPNGRESRHSGNCAVRRAVRGTCAATLALVAPALLAGCAAQGEFPSLAKRPAELVAEGRIARSALPAAPAAPALAIPQLPLPANLAERIATLGADARTARGQFEERRARAAQAVAAAAGAAPASAAWSVATIAVADLSSARSQTAVALASLDQLYVAQRINGGDGSAIAAVRDQVTAWVADEDAVLADLEGRLKG